MASVAGTPPDAPGIGALLPDSAGAQCLPPVEWAEVTEPRPLACSLICVSNSTQTARAGWAHLTASFSEASVAFPAIVHSEKTAVLSCKSLMDILHSYWRMEYITSPKEEGKERDNPFRSLPQMGDDRAALILHRSRFCYLVLNRYPYNPGHLLAIPFREVADIDQLSEEEGADLFALIVRGKTAVQKAMHPNGFNIGFNLGSAAGAGIPTHLHAHIVPRWNGDTNFMPVIGKTRTLPEALDRTWEKLREFFQDSPDTNA